MLGFKRGFFGSGESQIDAGELVPVDATYFYPGMNISFDVYSKTGKNIQLFSKATVLDSTDIKRMDIAEENGDIMCVTREAYSELMFNAAHVAEAEGTFINWAEVSEAAENPPTFEVFIENMDPELVNTIKNNKKNKKNKKPKSTMPEIDYPKPNVVPPPFDEYDVEMDASYGMFSDEEPVQEDTRNVRDPEKQVHIKEQLREYALLNERIEDFLHKCLVNYSVDKTVLASIAGDIVSFVTETTDDLIMQCMASLRSSPKIKPTTLSAHTQNVAAMNALISIWMGHSAAVVTEFAITGLIADLGKQLIPGRILNKMSKLTDEEFEFVKQHPIHSCNIALASGIKNGSIIAGVRGHHEKMNGSGYPDGLSGNAISLYARITAVSDIYDALVTAKPYKNDYSPLDALAEFADSRYTALDANVVDIVLDNLTAIFMDRSVTLSNGMKAKITSIDPNDYAHPTVLFNREYVSTDNDLRVVSINQFISD